MSSKIGPMPPRWNSGLLAPPIRSALVIAAMLTALGCGSRTSVTVEAGGTHEEYGAAAYFIGARHLADGSWKYEVRVAVAGHLNSEGCSDGVLQLWLDADAGSLRVTRVTGRGEASNPTSTIDASKVRGLDLDGRHVPTASVTGELAGSLDAVLVDSQSAAARVRGHFVAEHCSKMDFVYSD